MKVFALNSQGNQYKLMFEKNLGKFCESMYMQQKEGFQKLFDDFHDQSSAKVPWKTCPYPKGLNHIQNYALNLTDEFVPAYVPGGEKWQIQMRFYENDEVLGGYNVFGILRNERSLMAGG